MAKNIRNKNNKNKVIDYLYCEEYNLTFVKDKILK